MAATTNAGIQWRVCATQDAPSGTTAPSKSSASPRRASRAPCQMDKIGSLAAKDCDFKSIASANDALQVFLALAEADTQFEIVSEPLSFYQNVSPSKDLRDASNDAEALAKTAAQRTSRTLAPGRSSLRRAALVEKMFWMVLALENFNEENVRSTPCHFCYTKRTEDGKELFDVTYKTPDIFPIFKYAKNSTTRQRARGHESRLEVNVPLLSKAIGLTSQDCGNAWL
ncbi:hypothetical protein BDZ89DRAFT_1048555 [Hymenopellis radicata]|nr:hypothetical protein BDZ89DRAFT_1048555 [Hymenopellis radicata]